MQNSSRKRSRERDVDTNDSVTLTSSERFLKLLKIELREANISEDVRKKLHEAIDMGYDCDELVQKIFLLSSELCSATESIDIRSMIEHCLLESGIQLNDDNTDTSSDISDENEDMSNILDSLKKDQDIPLDVLLQELRDSSHLNRVTSSEEPETESTSGSSSCSESD